MTDIIIFDFSDYRKYLEARLKSSDFGRGGKARLAEHLCCQPSFVSQVLKARSTFSLEQAFRVNSFFKHNLLEKEYFMVLIEVDRAGTVELKKFFDDKREELIEKSKLVENQMSYDQLSEADSIAYYNNMNHIMIRNLIDIPALRSVKALKKKLNITDNEFKSAYDFLIDKGLMSLSKDGVLKQGHMRLHIKKESPLAKYANITARMHILKIYEKTGYNSMNYGCYMTLPKASFEEFKKRFRALVVELNQHLEEGQEADMMAALIVDFMEL